MDKRKGGRRVTIPDGSTLTETDYRQFLETAHGLIRQYPFYLAPGEGIDAIELAHIVPDVPDTVIALYVGINDAVCNKALVTPFLVRHAHNNVFAFAPDVYGGAADVPSGTVDAKLVLNGFAPPNRSWHLNWTYVMIEDPARTPESLWAERGYIDMIAAKLEDFTMLGDPSESAVCFFIDEHAFGHPVNAGRAYLADARRRGEQRAAEFAIPAGLEGETDGLVPVLLDRGEKLYVATAGFAPCEHAWSNIHPSNTTWAVVNENSAVPLDLITRKPPVAERFRNLKPARGSADLTTDWFYRGTRVIRKPLLEGQVKG